MGDQGEIFNAERILQKRRRKNKVEYLVKWQGYTAKHNTWEPEANIIDQRLINQFESEHKSPKNQSKKTSPKEQKEEQSPVGRPKRAKAKRSYQDQLDINDDEAETTKPESTVTDDTDTTPNLRRTKRQVKTRAASSGEEEEENHEQESPPTKRRGPKKGAVPDEIGKSLNEDIKTIIKPERVESPESEKEPAESSPKPVKEEPTPPKKPNTEIILDEKIKKTTPQKKLLSENKKKSDNKSPTIQSPVLSNVAELQDDEEAPPLLAPMMSEQEAFIVSERNRIQKSTAKDPHMPLSITVTTVVEGGQSVIIRESKSPTRFFGHNATLMLLESRKPNIPDLNNTCDERANNSTNENSNDSFSLQMISPKFANITAV